MLKKLDHIVITTASVSDCLGFYSKLGFGSVEGAGRQELYAGDFKINVHKLGSELSPHAGCVQSGSADICIETDESLEQYRAGLEAQGLEIELGIVERTGVRGTMQSIYLRDPDGNLVEICHYG